MTESKENLKAGVAAALGAALGTVSSRIAEANGDKIKEVIDAAKEKVSDLFADGQQAASAETAPEVVTISHIDGIDVHIGQSGIDVTLDATDAHGHATKLLLELGHLAPEGGVDASSLVVDVADHVGGEAAGEVAHGILASIIDHTT
ncbi:hypothetical protein [Magnetospirillum sp. 15-1]|uniref:hypothetical protein n=1 Tax=Magnetospirillum sp. 15-1 TaxID=1979370 RepID=UPI000BBCC0B6|nr:hypothetical protein [Magnetospirillum sp. 15-1]